MDNTLNDPLMAAWALDNGVLLGGDMGQPLSGSTSWRAQRVMVFVDHWDVL